MKQLVYNPQQADFIIIIRPLLFTCRVRQRSWPPASLWPLCLICFPRSRLPAFAMTRWGLSTALLAVMVLALPSCGLAGPSSKQARSVVSDGGFSWSCHAQEGPS